MLGDRIKSERLKRDITQKELAKLMEVSPSTIGMYEQNRREPDYNFLLKLAGVFNTSIDYLLGVSDNKNEQISEELPEDFKTPEEAIDFLLNKNVIMGFTGFDVNLLSDEDKVKYAEELLEHMKLLSYKYKKS